MTYLPVEPNGLVSLSTLAEAITERTLLVSVMAAHNEIGVIQPLAEIGALCRSKGVLFHSDAAQAFGKIPLDVEAMRIDLLSISGHKIYGPKGVGALYVRRRPRVRLMPLIDGGGQERGLRSGTLPTPLCVGLGRARRSPAPRWPRKRSGCCGCASACWTICRGVSPDCASTATPSIACPAASTCPFRGFRRRR